VCHIDSQVVMSWSLDMLVLILNDQFSDHTVASEYRSSAIRQTNQDREMDKCLGLFEVDL